ncbi:hypothetical protein ACH41E_02165 [Streptomyces sp. NPDC020412]|uniref:hypothetical protein n=1 Tax=Streptomyces sp. NPDC020412 TaxID=3365073 RepID=UPI0037A6A58B
MGIESDQLVYDYLSRVGDLAQQRQLPSGTRMELVSSLRGEIDRQRAGGAGDSPASVRRILGRLGTPKEVVEAATNGSARPSSPSSPSSVSSTPSAPPVASAPSAPARKSAKPAGTPPSAPEPPRITLPGQRLRKLIPNPRKDRPTAPAAPPAPPEPPRQGLPPHLAGLDELGPSAGPDADGDWWSVKPEPYGAGERIAGFTGGVEIPEILRPPRKDDAPDDEDGEAEEGAAEDDPAAEQPQPRGLLSRLRRRPTSDEAPAPGLGNPFLLLAALLLIGGALFTSWFALGLGWLCAYASRKLTVTERKVAVIGLPATAVTAGLVWLWGRSTGRWGEALPEDALGDAIASTGPWVVRAAALASALYLVLRARRA